MPLANVVMLAKVVKAWPLTVAEVTVSVSLEPPSTLSTLRALAVGKRPPATWTPSSTMVRPPVGTVNPSWTGVTVTVKVELDSWAPSASVAVKAMVNVPFQCWVWVKT